MALPDPCSVSNQGDMAVDCLCNLCSSHTIVVALLPLWIRQPVGHTVFHLALPTSVDDHPMILRNLLVFKVLRQVAHSTISTETGQSNSNNFPLMPLRTTLVSLMPRLDLSCRTQAVNNFHLETLVITALIHASLTTTIWWVLVGQAPASTVDFLLSRCPTVSVTLEYAHSNNRSCYLICYPTCCLRPCNKVTHPIIPRIMIWWRFSWVDLLENSCDEIFCSLGEVPPRCLPSILLFNWFITWWLFTVTTRFFRSTLFLLAIKILSYINRLLGVLNIMLVFVLAWMESPAGLSRQLAWSRE